MRRFSALFERANIDVADLPPTAELNGLFVYVGPFPDGFGRIFVHPDIPLEDSPAMTALIAHELAHILLGHPRNLVDMLDDPVKWPTYKQLENEANRLAAHLLVPNDLHAAFPIASDTPPDTLAQALGVPRSVVEHYLADPHYDATPVKGYLSSLIGQPDFAQWLDLPVDRV